MEKQTVDLITFETMKCFVCGDAMIPYFTKDFAGKWGLGIVEYWQCSVCGIVFSKTHQEMSSREWEKLNLCYHSSFFGTERPEDDPHRLPRLRSEATAIAKLAKANLLPKNLPWVDYGCGDGKLADFLDEYSLPVLKFERYVSFFGETCLTEEELISTKYSLVISTSIFEHIQSIHSLDEIADLVAESGVFCLHLLVRESIPRDPTWFYLLPVHCAFFTNKSMQVLFDRWKFKASIYHLESRMWFWFRQNVDSAKEFVEREKCAAGCRYYFKEGFMDYWK